MSAFLHCTKRGDVHGEKSDTEGKSAEMSYLQYMRSLWPSFAYASVCLGWRFLPLLLLPTVYYQDTHSTKFSHYLLLGLEKLFSIPGSYYDEDNKGVYQQFLPMERSLKKSWRDNIKGTTLISGEHVKPCNETYWKCLITAREMKLQDDSLIKQWLRIFCLLSNTVCNAF